MQRMRKYTLIALVLQLVMALIGHFSDEVMLLWAQAIGPGIPLVVGWLYSVRRGLSFRQASAGGMAIGAVGAFAGILLAILLGDAPWSLLWIGTVMAGVTGFLGGVVGWWAPGRKGGTPASA